jgi:hypothetical protein
MRKLACMLMFTLPLSVGCGSSDSDAGSAAGTGGIQAAAGGGAGGMALGPANGSGGTGAAGTSGAAGPGAGRGGGSGASGAEAGSTGAGSGGGVSAGTGGAASATCDASAGTGGGTPALTCDQIGGFCGECIFEKCCELAELCTVDADCTCMAECVGSSGVPGTTSCLGTCGLSGSPPGFTDLITCVASACSNPGGVGGECNVPAGFEPPPEAEPAPPMSSASIASGALADCSFGTPDTTGSVLQLQNADASVCVRIERRNDGRGSMANTNWTLLSMMVGPLGEVALVDDAADLCWYSSHHNFNDWAHAWSGMRRYEVKVSLAGHGTMPTYTLHVFEQGPLDAGACPPRSAGFCPIATIELFPAP